MVLVKVANLRLIDFSLTGQYGNGIGRGRKLEIRCY
jgi:hypothetical protein